MTRTLAGLLAIGLSLASFAGRAEARNPLLGKWKAEPNGMVGRDGFEYCKVIPEWDFDSTTKTVYRAGDQFRPAAHATSKAIYLISGQHIYVSETPSFVGAPEFTMLGPNEVVWEDAGSCKYTRM